MVREVKTILLVDDEAPIRQGIREILRRNGYKVVEAANYDQAVAVYQRRGGRVDLLLLDISLPGKNGYEIAQKLREDKPRLQTIFMSGHAGAELRRYHQMSPTDSQFLEKPFQTTELLQQIKSALAPRAYSGGAAG
jgi:CheY-like chemotaxis protein